MSISNCPVCNSSNLTNVLSRDNVPVHQNLLYSKKSLSVNANHGILTITLCEDCGFIFNADFNLTLLDYGKNYDNSQDLSSIFHSYLDNLSEILLEKKNVQNSTIVEVGCGKGTFLKKLIDADFGNIGYGFDPSYVGPLTSLDGKLNFQKSFYDQKAAEIKPDIIICRHVIEHVPEPIKFLKQIRNSLSPTSRIFFETPTVDWILKNNTVFDFFYEHCSYFSPNSICTAFEISGFIVLNVDLIFGGQYMWIEAIPSFSNNLISKKPHTTSELVKKYKTAENDMKKSYLEKIKNFLVEGKVAVWGAGAKGVTFVNLFDPKHELIDSIIDLNPNKVGKYLPGTGHKIISYENIPSRKIKNIFLMNPNYYNEIISLLKENNIDANLIP